MEVETQGENKQKGGGGREEEAIRKGTPPHLDSDMHHKF